MLSPLWFIIFLLSTASIPVWFLQNYVIQEQDLLIISLHDPQKPSLDWHITGLFKQTAKWEQFLIFIPLEPCMNSTQLQWPCYQKLFGFFLSVRSLLEPTFQKAPGDYQRDVSGPVKASPCNLAALKISTAVLAKLRICSLRAAKAWEKTEYKVKG